MRIFLTEKELNLARKLAEDTASVKWVGEHYPNTPESHLVGKMGEIAAAKLYYMAGVDIRPMFKFNRFDTPDIIVNDVGVEVKCWSLHNFARLGRAVTVGQYPKLKERSFIVIWAAVLDTHSVDLCGWNYISDLSRYTPKPYTQPGGKVVENYQVPMPEMRRISQLPNVGERLVSVFKSVLTFAG